MDEEIMPLSADVVDELGRLHKRCEQVLGFVGAWAELEDEGDPRVAVYNALNEADGHAYAAFSAASDALYPQDEED